MSSFKKTHLHEKTQMCKMDNRQYISKINVYIFCLKLNVKVLNRKLSYTLEVRYKKKKSTQILSVYHFSVVHPWIKKNEP